MIKAARHGDERDREMEMEEMACVGGREREDDGRAKMGLGIA